MAEKAELDVKGFGLATGTVCTLMIMVLGLTSMTLNWGTELVELASSIYIGYAATPTGIIIGALWALIDGLILGGSIAWLYNHFKD